MIYRNYCQWWYYGGAEGGVRPPKPPGRHHAVLTYSLHGTASKPYVDQEMDITKDILCNSRQRKAHQFSLMYSANSRICGLTRCSVSAKNRVFQLSVEVRESVSPRFRRPQNTLGPPIQSNDQQSTQFLCQADVQVLSTLSGGAAHYKFCACFSLPTLYCCARL